MRITLPSDRIVRVLLFAIALGVWTYVVAVVSRPDDYSEDLRVIESHLQDVRTTVRNLESEISDVETEVKALRTAVIFNR